MIPITHTDPVNAKILEVSEDRLQGFHRRPFDEIARLAGLETETVLERLRAMLESGTIRRIRQTLLSTQLAPGALVAWKVPPANLDAAFDFMFKQDPFSGHVVIRSTDAETAGSDYKLWTTLKVPAPFSMEEHAGHLLSKVGGERYYLMPAKGIFTLGVGHTRRKSLEPGSKSEQPAVMKRVETVELGDWDWRVLDTLKREFRADELTATPWVARAAEAGMEEETFCQHAEALNQRGVLGRFSTFLEHVKPLKTGERVTRFNGLFHWAVPQGREAEAGAEVGRHHILTHCYWREAGPEFNNVNIMAVAHGGEKSRLLEHKAAIDKHLESCGIPVLYTNVFWGGRSEIKPSEISPHAYRRWWEENGA